MVATPKIALTDEEITILKSYKRSRFSLVQHKAEALLLLEDGVTLDIIARFVERQPSTGPDPRKVDTKDLIRKQISG